MRTKLALLLLLIWLSVTLALAHVQVRGSRTAPPTDAALAVLTKDSRAFTGKYLVDEDVLRDEGETDFDKYAVKPGTPLFPDFFLD